MTARSEHTRSARETTRTCMPHGAAWCVEHKFIGAVCSRARPSGPAVPAGGYIDARYRAMTAVRRGLACMCPRAMAASVARANPHSLQAGCVLRGERRRAAARERTPRRNIRRGGLAAQRVDQRTSAFGGCLAHRERGGGSKAAEGRRPTTLLGKTLRGRCRCWTAVWGG